MIRVEVAAPQGQVTGKVTEEVAARRLDTRSILTAWMCSRSASTSMAVCAAWRLLCTARLVTAGEQLLDAPPAAIRQLPLSRTAWLIAAEVRQFNVKLLVRLL